MSDAVDEAATGEQDNARIRASLDICDECGNDLSGTSYAVSNAHAQSCSLHTDNVYPNRPSSPANTP